jgi:hypothetical protein
MGRREGPTPSDRILGGSRANGPRVEGPIGERLVANSPVNEAPVRDPRSVPPAIRSALQPAAPHCYRHCNRLVRPVSLASSLPGHWQVYSCPGGAVSVVSYVHSSRADPTPRVRAYLLRHTLPRSLVTRRDLRVATRHGPELGPSSERWLTRAGPSRVVRVVYWRVYPFTGRDGLERRLFVCFRHGKARPVFFPFRATDRHAFCPVCGQRTTRAAHRR